MEFMPASPIKEIANRNLFVTYWAIEMYVATYKQSHMPH